MNKTIKIGLSLFLVFALIIGSAFQTQQPDNKKYNVSLTIGEWQNVITIIDNAAVSGEVRKPLINAITVQVQAQLPKDTSSKKP